MRRLPLAVRFNSRQVFSFSATFCFFTQIVNLALIVTHSNSRMRLYLCQIVSSPLAVQRILLDLGFGGVHLFKIVAGVGLIFSGTAPFIGINFTHQA